MNWVCPYCQRAQVAQGSNYSDSNTRIDIKGLDIGQVAVRAIAFGCANKLCKKLTLSVQLCKANVDSFDRYHGPKDTTLNSWQVLPESAAKPQPDYIPLALREDYVEACRIRDLSPKASATLSRRCLQGMILDFCGISKARLIDEIMELRKCVDEGRSPAGVSIEAIDAIDQVRGIGNIGAHMEKDINLIIPVDAEEAQLLIDLIEMLFGEWYVARHQRQESFARIAQASAAKKQAIAEGRAAQLTLAAPTINQAATETGAE